MLYSNNDIILQSEGVKKGQKIAVILNVWPLTRAFGIGKHWFYLLTPIICIVKKAYLPVYPVNIKLCE